jgi:uncharacterized phage protein (TIGR02218 family)
MKTLPPGLQSHLASGTTTLCHCWRLSLKDGSKIGFTDHDRDLAFDGTTFEAGAGFTASSIEASLGLSVDNLEAQGALQSARLDDGRLAAGDFDHAEIEVWRVNWSDVAQRVLQRKGHLGEVTYGDGAFQAEVRGLAHLLNQDRGRLFQFGCDAELGDARCGVVMTGVDRVDAGIVASIEEAAVSLSGIAFADDWATRGRIVFNSGSGAGKSLIVKRARRNGAVMRVELWQRLPFAAAVGDAVQLYAGCDKQFSTCRDRFANAVNFRGFPHMPGTDFVAGFAASNDPNNDGGKRT